MAPRVDRECPRGPEYRSNRINNSRLGLLKAFKEGPPNPAMKGM